MDEPTAPEPAPVPAEPVDLASRLLAITRAGTAEAVEDGGDWASAAWRLAADAVDLERQVEELDRTVEELEVDVVEMSDEVERAIRREERDRLAKVFEENAETLAGVTPDGNVPIGLVVMLLRMENG